MKDKELKEILKRADEVNGYDIEIPDMSGKIKRLASSAELPLVSSVEVPQKQIERRNEMEIKKSTGKHTGIWFAISSVCIAIVFFVSGYFIPGLFKKKVPAVAVNKYEASPVNISNPNNINEKIKYSYTFDDADGNEYDFYYIYLGELKNIPLYYRGEAYKHTGINYTYTYSITETTEEMVSKTIANNSAETRGVVAENTVSSTTGAKISTELATEIGVEVGYNVGFSQGKASAKTSFKLAAEASFENTNSSTTSNSVEKTTSLTDTVENATRKTYSYTETQSFNFTKDEKLGYYRYTLFAASDVYLCIIKDSEGNLVDYEFEECVIPDTYFWTIDYSETPSFRKSDTTSFEFDESILDENLPKPKLNFKYVVEEPDLEALFANPDYTSLTELNNKIYSVSKTVLTVSLTDSSENNNKVIEVPANIQVLNIKGIPGRTFSNVRFEIAARNTNLMLTLWDFNFTAHSRYNAVTCNGDLDLNILGSCTIAGGNGVDSYHSSENNLMGGIGIRANNLTVKGITPISRLNITGGKGGNGLGSYTTSAYIGGGGGLTEVTRGMYGGDGGRGIHCANLIADIYSLNVSGGLGGNGTYGPAYAAGGRGGDGANGIYCVSFVNIYLDEECICIVKGGKGGNGGNGGLYESGGSGGSGGTAIQGAKSGLVTIENGSSGSRGANGY